MVKNIYIPERGDIVYLDLDPTLGHEQRDRRPAIVLSKHEYNSVSELMIILPITSSAKGYPFEIKINTKKIKGVILSDQVKSLDWTKINVTFVCKVDNDILIDIERYLRLLLF